MSITALTVAREAMNFAIVGVESRCLYGRHFTRAADVQAAWFEAIELVETSHFFFIDDDDDIPPTLLADHMARLGPGVDASSGAVDDATAGPPPVGFRHRRVSDVFPTNNTLLRRSALERSGLFDLAFDAQLTLQRGPVEQQRAERQLRRGGRGGHGGDPGSAHRQPFL